MDPVWHITTDGTPASPAGEGFVHASFPPQLAGSLAKHYAGAGQVLLLRLDAAALGETLVIEPSRDEQLFPHVYGEIAPGHVLERVTLTRGDDGGFDLSAVPGATS
ncbi:MAG: DUF952 domain-containing protein [Planctomycetota bacterium]|nr:MAG: DUF952 domain-containing protein [Planctomycetota bacterium]